MPIKYTFEICLNSALKYNTKKEWRDNARYFYHHAWENGWMGSCTEHMHNPYSAPTSDECIVSAKPFKHKVDWMRSCTREYSKAKNDKILYKQCTSHMIPCGNLKLRLIYMFYVGTICYIGLSGNIETRMMEHKSTQRYIDLSKCGTINLKILHELCDIETAITKEIEYIKYYKSLGWTVLNKTTGGELGGRPARPKSYIINQALKYNTIKEWKASEKSLYSTASKLGILDECCEHMTKLIHRWTVDEIKNEVLKYNNLKDWSKNSKNSYDAAYDRKIISDCSMHMTHLKNPKNYWNSFEKCLTESLKYKNTQEWKKYGKGSYFSAYKHDWWKIISTKIRENNEQSRIS